MEISTNLEIFQIPFCHPSLVSMTYVLFSLSAISLLCSLSDVCPMTSPQKVKKILWGKLKSPLTVHLKYPRYVGLKEHLKWPTKLAVKTHLKCPRKQVSQKYILRCKKNIGVNTALEISNKSGGNSFIELTSRKICVKGDFEIPKNVC